jgi:signal transduction histidine kinase
MNQPRGRISTRISRQVRLMLLSQIIWLLILLGFFTWWGTLLMRQAQHIAELEMATGVAAEAINNNLDKLNRIVFWEAGAMVLLVIIISLCILWLFLRDARRTRSVQTFFAGVTHELRTPMTGIRLQAESIAEKTNTSDPQYKLVHRLLEDTEKLESHLEQTLELARVEGGTPPQLQAIKLDNFLRHFVRDWHYAHGANHPAVQYEMGNGACMADPVGLKTIFRNLFDNTLKHSGNTNVSVAINAITQGHRVIVHYADNGQGFSQDPATLGSVFAKGPASSGSGVGLYLVSALMQQMGGSVRFKSANGFTADLDFPIAANAEGELR